VQAPILISPANGRQDAVRGLTSAQAGQRYATFGPNVVAAGRQRSVLVQLVLRFRDPLVLLLLFSAVVAGVTGDRRSSLVIVVVVLLSVALDFVQEHRAGRAAERLRRSAEVRTSVVRDGAVREIPAVEVVPDDVVVLSAGDLVPADGRLLEARDLFVNQALLTGEPYPIEKHAGAASAAAPGAGGGTDAAAPRADDADAVLMGTSVVSGSGRALIVRTGARTALGEIGASLQREPPPSSFEQGARAFGILILKLALLLVLFVILVEAWRGRPWLQSFLFAVALAVGLTPELLPMVVSVTLSRGAIRMSRQKVLVKRLAAIHDLGSMDVLCTDKTGTLTEARIRLQQHLDPAGRDSQRVLELAFVNSHFGSGIKSPLDQAILRHEEEVDAGAWEKLDEIPFDFERRCVSVLLRPGRRPGPKVDGGQAGGEPADASGTLLVVKGALEEILRLSSRYEGEAGQGDVRPLDDVARRTLVGRFEALGRQGFRVLGVATRALDRETATKDDERDLCFAGFAAFEDPPKQSAAEALRSLYDLGIRIKVLTGDNELVAEHVCQQVGVKLGNVGNVETKGGAKSGARSGVLTGDDVHAMDDHALGRVVEQTTLFCRMTPSQKNRVILALKRRKHAVGFLGDGINDAPALHAADVGISVDSAVDVAKEAADLILMEQDLAVLRDGVVEGRRTLGNIIKYLLMGTSSNFGNMFSMAGAAVFLPFLPMLPIQILVNNFLYDLSDVPIPTDEVDEEFLRRPHRWDMHFIRRFMLAIGPVSSIFDFITFYLLYRVLNATEAVFQTGWFVESLSTQVLVIFVIRTRRSPLRSRPSAAMAITALAVVAAGVVLPLTPLGRTLGFVTPPGLFFPILGATVAAYLATAEMVKRWFYRRVGAF